jgi:hypothetical protein
MRLTVALLAPLLALSAGCSQLHEVGIGKDPDAPPDTCGLGKVKRFKDMPASPGVLAEIGALVGEANVRAIRPGEAVTMDFRPDRLNVEIGAGGRIERLRCG